MKLKNKWDQLKKDWKLWKELKRGSTGLGWDPVKRTIDAPEEWWAEKLAVVPVAKKFKFNGIEPALEEKLDGMFTGVVATGTHFSTPNEQGVANLAEDIETEHIGDSGEGPSQTHTDIQSTGGTKRPRPVKNEKGIAFVRGSIETLIEISKNNSKTSKDSTIHECVKILNTILALRKTKICKYYLVDAGYPLQKGYLKPYPDTKYHIPDFERSSGVARGKKEIFNKRHSSLRGVIERSFDVWKKKWVILRDMSTYPFPKQVQIVVATMALHNFIRRHHSRTDAEFSVIEEDSMEIPPEARGMFFSLEWLDFGFLLVLGFHFRSKGC
ncbi:uncharacterized protein LOC110018511 [Phalaenopsis equestris]|uniref:uncharacterized protein LOC110018511 n=1 Tax=Phalaenopsis equestris TaxID=78828 RepID=UPI0009E3D6B8|nr:uncharacterized protein LOC110018511 [Phalaenopsis equestris]